MDEYEKGTDWKEPPIYTNLRVVPCDTALSLRMIELITLILEECLIAKHRKAMSKALGDK